VKKDHAIVADVMVRANSDASDSGQRLLIRNIVVSLARQFAEDNPRGSIMLPSTRHAA